MAHSIRLEKLYHKIFSIFLSDYLKVSSDESVDGIYRR